MTETYLPKSPTADEATEWLQTQTGEPWPLPRLIECGLRPYVWLTPELVSPEDFERLFESRLGGFLAEICFADDANRIAVDRTGFISWTRSPRGELFPFKRPVTFDINELRFSGSEIRDLADALRQGAPDAEAPAITEPMLVVETTPKTPDAKPAASAPEPATFDSCAAFREMAGLKPNELSICIVGNKEPEGLTATNLLAISARGVNRRIAMSDLGLIDMRSGAGKASKLGYLLLRFAQRASPKSIPMSISAHRGRHFRLIVDSISA
jgi:hypothetical protein